MPPKPATLLSRAATRAGSTEVLDAAGKDERLRGLVAVLQRAKLSLVIEHEHHPMVRQVAAKHLYEGAASGLGPAYEVFDRIQQRRAVVIEERSLSRYRKACEERKKSGQLSSARHTLDRPTRQRLDCTASRMP
jgi:hypothetical protein